jgi:hypothetical protein
MHNIFTFELLCRRYEYKQILQNKIKEQKTHETGLDGLLPAASGELVLAAFGLMRAR